MISSASQDFGASHAQSQVRRGTSCAHRDIIAKRQPGNLVEAAAKLFNVRLASFAQKAQQLKMVA
jgi:hypothetical protein